MATEEIAENSKSVTLLSGRHYLYPKSKLRYEISVTNSCITWTLDSPSGTSSSLNFSDVLGCDCMKGKNKNDPNAYITVYAYPHKKKFASNKTVRQRQTLTFAFDNKDTFEENSKDSEPWRKLIMCLAKNIPVKSADDVKTLEPPAVKKLLVLVNPFSGPGKALSIFQQRVVPILAEANIHFNMVITEYAGHASKLVQGLKLDDWYGVVIVSGDGLIYEVVNGLMQHENWEEAIRTPLGCLPGGSGNALAAALLYAAKEPYLERCVLHSAFLLAKHDVAPMDLVAVDTCDGQRLFSFLSVCWGIIADVDIESEKYRKLGPVRFTIGALVRIINLRKYSGRLSFLPVEPYHPPEPTRRQSYRQLSDPPPTQPFRRSQSEMAGVGSSSTQGSAGDPIPIHPNALSPLSNTGGEPDGLERVNGGENGENGESGSGNIGINLANGDQNQLGSDSSKSMTETSPVPTPLLNPLSKPVPEDWTTIEDDFVLVGAIYQTHLAIDMLSTPQNRIDDGLIHLSLIRYHGMTRTKLIKLMTAMETGAHIGMAGVETIPCKAFRIVPLEEGGVGGGSGKGIMTVDGEAIECGPVQGQVLPSCARVMTRK